MFVANLTLADFWYPDLYAACFNKKDAWFNDLSDSRYKAYHIGKKAFLIARLVDDFECELLTIGVLPEFRRQGLAKTLFAKLRDDVCGSRKPSRVNDERGLLKPPSAAETGKTDKLTASFFLEVRADNPSAIALYRALGFSVIAKRHGYYRDADALIMRLIQSTSDSSD